MVGRQGEHLCRGRFGLEVRGEGDFLEGDECLRGNRPVLRRELTEESNDMAFRSTRQR